MLRQNLNFSDPSQAMLVPSLTMLVSSGCLSNNKYHYQKIKRCFPETKSSLSSNECHYHKQEMLSPRNKNMLDSDDEGGVGSDDDEAENVKKFVQESILRLVEMKQEMGCSINHFEELLKWGKDLHTSGNIDAAFHWPEKWDEVQSLLKELGFSEPKHFWICFSKDHPCHYGLMESKDELCPHCGCSGAIPYNYLGLPDKVEKGVFLP